MDILFLILGVLGEWFDSLPTTVKFGFMLFVLFMFHYIRARIAVILARALFHNVTRDE